MEERFEALVIQSTGSWYRVRNTLSGVDYDCRIRGRLRLDGSRATNPVVVGDRVECLCDNMGQASIERIMPRTNYIIRRASNLSKESHVIAANIDRALIMVSLASPATPREFVDRFLVTCSAYRIPATILLNKIDSDEFDPNQAQDFVDSYSTAGYEVIPISATTGAGTEKVAALLRGKTTLLSGNSGVGKSTLVKLLEPQADIRIGQVSQAHHKGMHTTTFSQMYPLREGGYLIDSPGIKGFGLIDIDSNELWHYFPEMIRLAGECQYYNCTHTHEPGCAVVKAVEEGQIAFSRYESYLKILDEDEKYR